MFDIRLALNGISNVHMGLDVNEALKLISFGEPFDQALAMLVDSSCEIARYACIERAVRFVRHDVDKAASHRINAVRRGWPEQVRP